MRVLYFSDIHLEQLDSKTRIPWTDIYPLDLGPCLKSFVGRVDLVVLAGDIAPAYENRGLSAVLYAKQVAQYLDCDVVLVPGNHEYYGAVFEDARDTLMQCSERRVHILDRGEVEFHVRGESIRVLGATLWTDYELEGDFRSSMERARNGLRDHSSILTRRGCVWQPSDALYEHNLTREWLTDRLVVEPDTRTLIVTHHPPHEIMLNPAYQDLRPCFASNMGDIIMLAKSSGVVAWISGHTHFGCVTAACGLPLVSCQFSGRGDNSTGPHMLEF